MTNFSSSWGTWNELPAKQQWHHLIEEDCFTHWFNLMDICVFVFYLFCSTLQANDSSAFRVATYMFHLRVCALQFYAAQRWLAVFRSSVSRRRTQLRQIHVGKGEDRPGKQRRLITENGRVVTTVEIIRQWMEKQHCWFVGKRLQCIM